MTSIGSRGYRLYSGEKRGRFHRFISLFRSNFLMMIKMKRVYIVIFITLFFLFFTVLEIAFSQPLEDAQEEFLSYQGIGSFFEIRPTDETDLEIEAFLGENITLEYTISNVGNKSSMPFFLFYSPSLNWEFELVQPLEEIAPGESMEMKVDLSVPDSMINFSTLAPHNLDVALVRSGIDDLIPPEIWENLFSDEGRVIFEVLGEYIQDPFTRYAYSTMYEREFGRFTMLYAIPGDVIESLISGFISYDLVDPRITSITNLIQVDIEDDRVQEYTRLEPREGHQDSFELVVHENSSSLIRTEMFAEDTKTLTIELRNEAMYPIEVDIEALLMPVTDPEWGAEIYQILDPRFQPENRIDPGESIFFDLVIVSGFIDAKMPYNLVVLATDISQSSYWNSEVTQIVVDIEGDKPGNDLEQEYFDTMWGEGLAFIRFLMLILLAAVAGSTLISNDLKNNTLALYFSRPITWFDYLAGKWSSLFLVLCSVTLLPALILFAAEMAFMNEGFTFIFSKLWLIGAAFISYMMALIVFTSVALAFSSLSKRWIVAGVGIFSFFLITPIIGDILHSIFDNEHLKLININLVFRYAFTPLFGLRYDADQIGFSVLLPWLVLAFITAVSLGVMIVRFRGREVAR